MNKKTILSITLSLLLMACGGGDSDKKSSNTEENQHKISIPKEIGIDIPASLKNESTTQNKSDRKFQKETEGSESIAHMQLKEDLSQQSFMKEELEINLLLAGQLMGDIEQLCKDTALNETCIIPAKKLSLPLDEDIRDEINDIQSNNGINDIDQNSIPLGQVEFTQYDDSKSYKYALKMDLTNIQNSFVDGEEPIVEETQTIKWSKDEKHIFSSYYSEDSIFTSTMTLKFDKKENGDKEMIVDDSFVDKESKEQDNFHFKIIQKADENEHFVISSHGEYNYYNEDKMESGSFSSSGEIATAGGYLTFAGSFDGEEFKDKELFDAEGNFISRRFCDSTIECNINDESTWKDIGDMDFEDIDMEEEDFEPLEDYEYVELTLTGGSLSQGDYIILAPNSDISDKSIDEVFDAVIGNISIYDDIIYANLNSTDYNEQLANLVIVQLIFAKDPEEIIEPTFKVIDSSIRPTLTIQESPFSIDEELLIDEPNFGEEIEEELELPI